MVSYEKEQGLGGEGAPVSDRPSVRGKRILHTHHGPQEKTVHPIFRPSSRNDGAARNGPLAYEPPEEPSMRLRPAAFVLSAIAVGAVAAVGVYVLMGVQ